MATKTISIDLEAYRRLRAAKQDNESFSQTIKRVVQRPIDFDQWMASIEKDPLTKEAVEAIETVISQRRAAPIGEAMALLDTSALVDLGRSAQWPAHQRVQAAVHHLLGNGHTLFTSRINEAEFRVGPEMSRQRQQELLRVERVLANVLILEFNAAAAQRYAIIKAVMLRRGIPIGDCDTLVASVALAHGQLVLTRNSRHFDHVPGLIVQAY